MPATLKTACEWIRSTRWHVFPDGTVLGSASHNPSRFSVEYRTDEDGRDRVSRVMMYSGAETLHQRGVEKILLAIPAHLKQKVARIVQENERNYGRVIYGVSLPDGEIVYA
jgi:hypothetical protein